MNLSKYVIAFIFLVPVPLSVYSQEDSIISSVTDLPSLQIAAYSTQSDIVRLPAAVQIIQDSLHTDQLFSFAKSFNQAPGIKLEERSPGSYRLSIRGSTLRSPFGVRNVKIYLDGFNITDGGGNTYLQLINPEIVSKAEIIKGPASSMYGAGTGGAVLFSTDMKHNSVSVGYGSFNQKNESVVLVKNVSRWKLSAMQSFQQSDGYREQSEMKRQFYLLKQEYQTERSKIKLMQWYGDLLYQTPGGLTLDQFSKNRRQARPATNTLPSAVTQNASIHNKTAMVAGSYEYSINNEWTLSPVVNYWYTDFKNPFITNYESRIENNISARPTIQYHKQRNNQSYSWVSGIEYSLQHNITKNFVNNKGIRGNLTSDAAIQASQSNLFTQFQWDVYKWQLLAGISSNHQVFKYKTIAATDYTKKESGPVLMPRLSLSYSIRPYQSVFISLAKGNSPPTLAEIRPSSGEINKELLPEYGWNYELGYKLFTKQFDIGINAYRMKLNNAIVRRNDAAGVEYFVNAGGAHMNGLESSVRWHTSQFSLSTSIAYQPFTFDNYTQRNENFDGNEVTGVPRSVFTLDAIYKIVNTIDLKIGLYHQSKLPLNDANTIYTDYYDLLYSSIIFKPTKKLFIFLNGQFTLRGEYQPGPDINAAANRFFNAGAPTIISGGVKLNF